MTEDGETKGAAAPAPNVRYQAFKASGSDDFYSLWLQRQIREFFAEDWETFRRTQGHLHFEEWKSHALLSRGDEFDVWLVGRFFEPRKPIGEADEPA